MRRQIGAIIAREEAFLLRFAPGSPQHSLLRNRIAALNTVLQLIDGEERPDREALAFALPRIGSMLHKMKTARNKYEPGSRNYRRFDPGVQLMEAAQSLLLRAMEDI